MVRPGPGERIPIEATGRTLHVTINWPGDGRVVLELAAPDGEPVTPDSLGVSHERGPTFESYHVSDAQAGTWSALLTGVGVPPEGAVVRLSIHQEDSPQLAAALVLSQQVEGTTLSASVDVRDAAAYLWEFGDGTTSRDGPAVQHTYTQPGRYRVSVAVQDADGRWRVATAEEEVVVP